MKIRSSIAPMSAILLAFACPASAQIYEAISSFDTGVVPSGSAGRGGFTDIGGIQFLTGGDVTRLESVSFVNAFGSSSPGSLATVSLYEEGTIVPILGATDNGNYGAWILDVGTASTTTAGVVTVIPSLEVILQANTYYWIGVNQTVGDGIQMTRAHRPDNTGGILADFSSDPTLGWEATASHGSGTFVQGPTYPEGRHVVPYYFNISASIVPEPSSLLLFGMTGALWGMRRRK